MISMTICSVASLFGKIGAAAVEKVQVPKQQVLIGALIIRMGFL